MLKWELRLKSRLGNLEVLDRYMLDGIKAVDVLKKLNGFKALDGLKVLNSLKVLNGFEILNDLNMLIGLKVFYVSE